MCVGEGRGCKCAGERCRGGYGRTHPASPAATAAAAGVCRGRDEPDDSAAPEGPEAGTGAGAPDGVDDADGVTDEPALPLPLLPAPAGAATAVAETISKANDSNTQ